MEVERIVLAVTDMTAMVAFYNGVFKCDLTPVGAPDSFHVGRFFGTTLLLCPNAIAGVDAQQNRHQYRIAVSDVDSVVAAVVSANGTQLSDDHDDDRRLVGISDPDGNTYELVGQS